MRNSAYMSYFTHLGKLSSIANKQTMFLNHMLYYMEYDKELKQLIVEMTPRRKRMIMSEINPNASNPLGTADQYIHKITKSGLIKGVGAGLYLLDPTAFSLNLYMKKSIRDKTAKIYETRVFTETHGSKVVSSYLVDEDGVQHAIMGEEK